MLSSPSEIPYIPPPPLEDARKEQQGERTELCFSQLVIWRATRALALEESPPHQALAPSMTRSRVRLIIAILLHTATRDVWPPWVRATRVGETTHRHHQRRVKVFFLHSTTNHASISQRAFLGCVCWRVYPLKPTMPDVWPISNPILFVKKNLCT
jgi:hypothetical protein